MARTDSPTRAVARSLRRLYADAAHVDLSQSDPVVSGRNALGLVIPLALGAAFGHPAIGVQATIGGLQTAFADRPGPYRLRMARMLATALVAALTAGLAAGFGNNVVASAILLAVLGFAAGQLLAVGPSAAQVGVAATGCALVLGHIPASPLAALYTGLLVLAGGSVQTVLAIAAWPLGRHRPERRSLATLYEQLAGLAEQPIDTTTGPPLGAAVADTIAVLRGVGHDHGPSVEAYRILLDEAVRARQDIIVLSGYANRLKRDGNATGERALSSELDAAAAILRYVAELLQTGHHVGGDAAAELLRPVGLSVATLADSLTEQAAVTRVRSLAGQLRAMLETARTGAGEGRTDEDDGRLTGVRLRDPIAILRANLNPQSPTFRHSLRLGILVPLTDIGTRLIGIDRGYWVSLTILVVLRPDFGSTFQRSLMRVIGTLIGLLFASAIVHYLLGDWQPGLIILLGIFFFGMRMSGPNNMALAAICLSGLVVVLLSLAGFPAHTTVVDRSVDTVCGGVIALVASLLWPSWERRQVPDRVSALIGAYRDYLLMMVDPDTTGASRSAVRSRARLARSAAEASLDRARSEPVAAGSVVEVGSAVLAHTHRLVHALTAIDATRQAREVYQKVPEFRFLIDAISRGLATLQTAIRDGHVGVRDLGLRPLHSALVEALPASSVPAELAASLVEATDRIVNSLDSAAAVVRDHYATVAVG